MKVLIFAYRALSFTAFYLFELVISSLRVAHDVLTPRDRMRPGIVEVPTRARSDLELTLLAGLINLTPGTLAIAIAPDRRSLFVHAMFIDDGNVERVRSQLQSSIEGRVLRLLRTLVAPAGGAS